MTSAEIYIANLKEYFYPKSRTSNLFPGKQMLKFVKVYVEYMSLIAFGT